MREVSSRVAETTRDLTVVGKRTQARFRYPRGEHVRECRFLFVWFSTNCEVPRRLGRLGMTCTFAVPQ
jgi:hypothetical protein